MKTESLKELLARSLRDEPLWLPELRAMFDTAENRPVILRLYLHGGGVLDRRCPLPHWSSEEEQELVTRYFCATVYNLLSVYSARGLCCYVAPELRTLAEALPKLFETRPGYAKTLKIARRLSRYFKEGPFFFETAPLGKYVPQAAETAPEKTPLGERLRRLLGEAETKALIGIDVGGTDIKLAAARGSTLVCVKEYDWDPSRAALPGEISGPILLLTRLMRACLTLFDAEGPLGAAAESALRKDAPEEEMRSFVDMTEKRFGEALLRPDGIGLSFPDIVIGDRILGGETPKTAGLRQNPALDYEEAFAELGRLGEELRALGTADCRVGLTNDGNMAAFAVALELAAGGRDAEIASGVLAHSLGTDLGTGWLQPDGSIPALPLEFYDLIFDLGSAVSAAWPAEDLRSVRNENSGLPGARRYMGQAAAYRLAGKLCPARLEGFAEERNGLYTIPSEARKPCLEHLMRLAAEGDAAAEDIFRQIGRHLGLLSREALWLLAPETETRWLFGRFVKSPRCFALIKEGFDGVGTGLKLVASDSSLAFTPLMRALAGRKDLTVAQFAQAVAAACFAAEGNRVDPALDASCL